MHLRYTEIVLYRSYVFQGHAILRELCTKITAYYSIIHYKASSYDITVFLQLV
jgi:hypothetical protein